MAEVVISNLSKSYPARKGGTPVPAVDNVSLTIADREFMVLVGPSGCGKSTTLRLVAGLEEESSGTISIGGTNVTGVLPKDRDIAMVFQNYALYPHMSVAENMGFGLKLRKVPVLQIAERVRIASALLGLDALLDRRPKELSGGQRQRVAVGRAIVRNPKVFLFDEPLSNLDAQMRVSMRAEISRLHARLGATMIYVTHDQVEAMTMGDRICVMNAGRIMQVADPLALYNDPANRFVAGFIGTPAMNFFEGELFADGGRTFFRETNAKAAPVTLPVRADLKAGQKVTLGLRAEDIALPASSSPRAGLPHAPSPMPPAPTPPTAPTAPAVVELSEPMGSETYLHLNTGATSFIARVSPETRYSPGDKVEVAFDAAKAHVFDAATGERL